MLVYLTVSDGFFYQGRVNYNTCNVFIFFMTARNKRITDALNGIHIINMSLFMYDTVIIINIIMDL